MYTKYSKKLNVNFSDRLVTKLYSRYVVYLILKTNKHLFSNIWIFTLVAMNNFVEIYEYF
jgi:hypothetical protein